MQQVMEQEREKYNLGIQFGNLQKRILDNIDPDDVNITGVNYE